MQKVVLDTNMLLVPFQFHVDIFSEIDRLMEGRAEPVLLSPCVEELKALAAGSGRDARAAKAALDMVERLKLNKTKAGGPADDAIVEYALKEKAAVCTNDKELRDKLRKKGIRTIGLRDNSHLAFV